MSKFKQYKAKLRRKSTIRKNAVMEQPATCPDCGSSDTAPLMGDFVRCNHCGYEWDEDYEQYQRDIGAAGQMYDSLDNLGGLPTTPHPQGQE